MKRTYPSLLPTDRLVNIVLSLDAHADEATQKAAWPSDLKQGVITVAVEAILGHGAKDKGLEALKALGIDAPGSQDATGKDGRPLAVGESAGLSPSATTSAPLTNGVIEKMPLDNGSTMPLGEPMPTPIASVAPPSTAAATFTLPTQQAIPASSFASGSFPY